MISTLTVGSGRRTLEREVPFEKIGFEWSGVQGWIRVAREFGCFFQDALYSGRFGVEGWKGHDVGIEKSAKAFIGYLINSPCQ